MMALSIVTRWQDLAFAFAWFCALVAGLGFRPGHRYEKRDAPKTRAFVLLLAFAVAALVLLPQLGYKLVEGAPLAGQSWLEGWRPSNFLARSFDNVDGHFDYALPVALFYAQVAAHPAYISPLLTPFLVVGMWLLAKRVQAEPELPILFLAWIGTMYLFLAGIPYENFRFGLGFLTPVAVLTGIGVAWTWEKLQAETTASSVLRAALGLLVVVAFAAMTFWQLRALEPVLVQKQMELTHARRLQARLPEGATLYTFGVTGALQVYTGLHVVDLSEELPERIRADTARTSPAYLFLDASNIETQWRGHELAKTFETLRDRVGLTELEQIDRWTLFQIRATP
jgi:hypothetical protein